MEPQKPVYQMHQIELLEKRHEHGEVYTFLFSPINNVTFQAGQYVHMKIDLIPPLEEPVREFSFASAPGDPLLAFSVNTASGSPFQEALKNLSIGERVSLFKIKGHMTIPEKEGPHLVLIAHGVGVAPFRSILRDLTIRKIPLSATLIQIDRGEFLYEKELSLLPFEQYRVQRKDIDRTLERVKEGHPSSAYYVAGAPGFVENTVSKLLSMQVSKESIQTDIFTGLLEE